MDAIFQMTFSNGYSWMKMCEFWLKFHWSLFLRVQLTIFQHWFRWWLGADQATSHYLNQWWLVYRRIYASLGPNELKDTKRQILCWLYIQREGKKQGFSGASPSISWDVHNEYTHQICSQSDWWFARITEELVTRSLLCLLITPCGWSLTWWRHQMETFSTLPALSGGNSPVPGEFPAQRPVTRSFDVFFDLRLNKHLSKQSWGWWFETCNIDMCFVNLLCDSSSCSNVLTHLFQDKMAAI